MRFDYHRPRTLEEARSLKAGIPGSRYVAGGTDLLMKVKSGQESPSALISLRAIPDLSGIEMNGATTIGAATTFTQILEHPEIFRRFPVFGQAVSAIGSVQIRNAATLGGNLCNAIPCADSAPALLVLDARLRALSSAGRRDIPIGDFFLGPRKTCLDPAEILESIIIQDLPPGGRAIFLKKGRTAEDLALASVAVLLVMDPDGETCRRARVAAGSVAPTPLRLKEVEALLQGRKITADVLSRARDRARDEISPISDVRASADYRRHLTGVLLGRALTNLLETIPA
jgi:CO/xanthine dehydrogenase FAD-binding subunit